MKKKFRIVSDDFDLVEKMRESMVGNKCYIEFEGENIELYEWSEDDEKEKEISDVSNN